MKISHIIYLSLLLIEIASISNDFDELNFLSASNNDSSYDIHQLLNLTSHLNVLLELVQIYDKNISHGCLKGIRDGYHNNVDSLKELYEGSSKGFIDLNSFSNCLNSKSRSNTFYTVYPNLTDRSITDITRLDQDNLDQHFWIFGVCLKKDICTLKDIGYIFDSVNGLFAKTFKLYTKDNITIFDYYEEKARVVNSRNIATKFIPLIFVLIQIILMIFKIIPTKIFGFFIRRRYIREVENTKTTEEALLNNNFLNNQISLKIRQCFSVSEIFEDLIYSKKNEIFKDEDMTYIKGVKTLGIVLFILGFNFIVLYNYPLCQSEAGERKDYMKSDRTILLVMCFRLSPALILSSSGYSLCYKFLNFLDNKLVNISLYSAQTKNDGDKTKNDNIINNSNDSNNIINDTAIEKLAEKTEKQTNTKEYSNASSSEISSSKEDSANYYENTVGIKFYKEDITNVALSKMFKGQRVNESLALSEVSTDKIPGYLYFNFFFRQIHKAVCLGLGITLFKHTFPLIFILVDKGPLIYKINKDFFEKLGTTIGNILYYKNFVALFDDEDSTFSTMQLFFIAISELNSFVVCSILIFVCYKKKLRLDIIIIVLTIIFIVFKIIYVLSDIKNKNPGMFYTDTKYQKFFFNPLFNFDYFLIGMFFGILNYVLQNDMIKKEALTNERPFVKIPIKLSKFFDYQKNKNYFRFIITCGFLIFFLIIVPLLFFINFENIIMNNDPDYLFAFLSLIDIDFFIILFHFVLISSYISGRNLLFRIFDVHLSSYGMKLGFWIILGTPAMTYIIIYINEANINLRFFTVIIYGFITLFTTSLVGFVFFLILEMPYKKLVKLYFNISSVLNKIYLEDEVEEDNKNINDIGLTDLNENDIEDNNQEDKNKDEDDDDEIIKV